MKLTGFGSQQAVQAGSDALVPAPRKNLTSGAIGRPLGNGTLPSGRQVVFAMILTNLRIYKCSCRWVGEVTVQCPRRALSTKTRIKLRNQ